MDPGIRLFSSYLVRVLPPDVALDVGERIAQALGEAFVSPLTMMAKVEAIIDGAIGGIDVGDLRRHFIEDLPSLWLEWAHGQVEADNEQLQHAIGGGGAARELLHALMEMFGVAEDKARFYGTFQSSLAEFDPLKAAAALGGLFKVPDSEDITLERRLRLSATAVAKLAECHYKPSLRACLRLTLDCVGREGVAPDTLGALVAECRKVWKCDREMLLPLLMDEVCIIRNSEAHEGTVIDPKLGTVTFVNTMRNGDRRVLGPLSADDYEMLLHRIEAEFLALRAALDCAFRRIWMMHHLAST